MRNLFIVIIFVLSCSLGVAKESSLGIFTQTGLGAEQSGMVGIGLYTNKFDFGLGFSSFNDKRNNMSTLLFRFELKNKLATRVNLKYGPFYQTSSGRLDNDEIDQYTQIGGLLGVQLQIAENMFFEVTSVPVMFTNLKLKHYEQNSTSIFGMSFVSLDYLF